MIKTLNNSYNTMSCKIKKNGLFIELSKLKMCLLLLAKFYYSYASNNTYHLSCHVMGIVIHGGQALFRADLPINHACMQFGLWSYAELLSEHMHHI